MEVDKLKHIIELEYYKIALADSFLVWEIAHVDLYNCMELRFSSVLPWNFEQPLTKMYLVDIFKDYMKAKDRIMKFINKSNLYERYLFYRFDYGEYHRLRKQQEVAISAKVMQVKWHNSINIIQFQITTLLSLQA